MQNASGPQHVGQVGGGFHLEAAHESRDRLLSAGVAAPEWEMWTEANVQGLTRTTSPPFLSHGVAVLCLE